jgi:DNA-binding response OmpR family regulator
LSRKTKPTEVPDNVSAADHAVVLVVEDEPGLADLFTDWLHDRYEVLTATSGQGALELYSPAVDVVLLDRRMPGLTGDEVLERIRDAGGDCGVAMVTAVEPDFDVLEMGFDAYLTKPIDKDRLIDVVERLLKRAHYDVQEQEYFSLVSKRVARRSEKSVMELEADERYLELEEQIGLLRAELDETAEDLDGEDFEAAFHDL